jgi:hypothetical protein
MQKIIQFIKYNNFFTIALMFIVLGSGVTFAATPQGREAIVSSTDTVRSIDNTYIRTAHLDAHNFNLKVSRVTEDQDNYYIDYSYTNIDIKDFVWQPVFVQKSLNVNKKALDGHDLGLYVSEQLGQLVDSQLVYLKEAQKIENAKGATYKVVSTQYAGLIGSMLSSREKVFNGYVPVIPEPQEDTKSQVVVDSGSLEGRSQSIPLSEQIAKRQAAEALQREVNELLARQNQPQPEPEPTPEPEPQATTTPPVVEPEPQATTTPPVVEPEPEPEPQATTTPPVVEPEPQATTTPPVVEPEPEPEPQATTTPPVPPVSPPVETPAPSTASTTSP